MRIVSAGMLVGVLVILGVALCARQIMKPAGVPFVSWFAVGFALVAPILAAKVGVDAGGPRALLTVMQVATIGVVAFLAADPRGRRWLDAPRAILLSLAILLVPTVYGEVGGDGWQAFVVVRSALLDHDL